MLNQIAKDVQQLFWRNVLMVNSQMVFVVLVFQQHLFLEKQSVRRFQQVMKQAICKEFNSHIKIIYLSSLWKKIKSIIDRHIYCFKSFFDEFKFFH